MYDTIKRAIPALLVTLGIVVLGFCIKAGIESMASRDRIVTVRGLSELEVKADKVTWPIVYKQVGNDLPALYDYIQSTNNAIIKFLTDNGVSEDEISVNPPDLVDLQAQLYNSNTSPYRYNITSTIVVSSGDVDKVRDLIKRQSELLRQGIAIVEGDYNNQITYDYNGLNDIKPNMIAEATANARAAGEKFASDSDSKLGKIKTASQGQFSIEDRDSNTPYIKTIRVVSTITFYLED